jgi:hypothetical protein
MFVLLTGRLWRDPVSRQSRAGKPFVTALLKAGTQAESLWVNIVAFSETAQAELLRLHDHDSLAVQGAAKIGTFEKNGEHRASLEVIAAHILALRQPQKPRTAKPKPIAANAPDFDDGLPEWGGPGE